MAAFINRTGQTFNGLTITVEIGKSKVTAICTKCLHTDDYDKCTLVSSKIPCRKCFTRIVNKEGQNNWKLYRNKRAVVLAMVRCNHCGLTTKYKGKVVNNVEVIEFAYIGRDNRRYYTCVCNNCGEQLALTRERIVNYSCNNDGGVAS